MTILNCSLIMTGSKSRKGSEFKILVTCLKFSSAVITLRENTLFIIGVGSLVTGQ